MTKSIDEPTLITLAKTGDIEAFSELVKYYERDIRAFLAVRINQQSEADDLAQETFIIAFNKISDFEEHRPLKAWLKGIALNLLKNYWRKHKAILVGTNDELELLINDQIHQQSQENESSYLEALSSCLKGLEPKVHDLLNKHYTFGFSIKELTTEYNVGHSTMTMRLHRIRDRLKVCIYQKLGLGDK